MKPTAVFTCDRCPTTTTQPAHALEVLHRCPTTRTLRPMKRAAQPSHP